MLPPCWSLGCPPTLVEGSCRLRKVLGFEIVTVTGVTIIADETGGKPVQISGDRLSGRGTGYREGGPTVWKGDRLSGKGTGCLEGGPTVWKGDRLSARGTGCLQRVPAVWKGGPAVWKGDRLYGRGTDCLEGGPVVRKGGRRPKILHIFPLYLGTIMVCRLHKLTLSDQAQVTLQLRVSPSDLV